MKALNRTSLVSITALLVTVGIAYADQPPNVVDSDSDFNTAMGTDALLNLTTGAENTASGFEALVSNTSGTGNTAFGVQALMDNTTGLQNTATGNAALWNNTAGIRNTAIGAGALFGNTTGDYNTASGTFALFRNETGNYNTAFGAAALEENETGSHNIAMGRFALFHNVTGIANSAVGTRALYTNTTGRNNTAIGYRAGDRVTGNDNINLASRGVGGQSQTMRLGTQGSAGVIGSGVRRTYIAGIRGVTTALAGSAVLVDAHGQLGTISSSRRYKEDIEPIADASEKLSRLRPVQFHYKQTNESARQDVQYGLIAEEVADVFPELVIAGEDGQPETVAYHILPALLLNELQKAQQVMQQQAGQLAAQESEVNDLKRQMDEMKSLLAALHPQNQGLRAAVR